MISFVDVPLDKPEGAVFLFLLAGLALGYTSTTKRRAAPALTQTVAFSDGQVRGSGVLGTGRLTARPNTFFQPDIALTLRLATPYVRAARTSGRRDGLYIPLPGQLQASDTLPMQLTAPLPRISITESSGELQSAPKTGRSALIQILAWAVAVPLIFPSTALMTRYFGPEQFGEYNFTLSILAVCALCTMTGMDSWLIRHLSRQKRAAWGQILGEALGTRLLTSLIVTGAAALLIWFLPLASEQRILLLLGAGTLTFSFSFNCVRAICECGFVAEQQMSMISFLTTLNRVATAGLIVLAVILRLSLIQAYILIAYSDLPFFLILLLIVRKRYQIRLSFKPARIWSILRDSVAFTGYDALALFSGQIDILLLLPLAGALSVGIYALALRITNPLLNIAFAYVGALYPFLCARFDKGRQEFAQIYHEATRILALGIIPLSLFIIVEAPAIVSLLAGGDFAQAVMPTRLLMGSIALVFFSQLTLRACMAANKEKAIPLISAVTLVTTLLANALLIPRWQAEGAALAALLAELVSVGLFAALLASQVHLWKTLVGVLLVLLGNLPGLAFLLWQPHLPLLVLAGGFAVLVLLGCVITRSLTLKDVHMALEIVNGRLGRKKG
jgi:O-antigen/teichoic acid export membrane protein